METGQRENRGDKGASDTQTGLTGDLEADPVGQAPSTPLCKHIIASFGFKLSRKLQIVRTRKDLRALSVEPIICTKAETIKNTVGLTQGHTAGQRWLGSYNLGLPTTWSTPLGEFFCEPVCFHFPPGRRHSLPISERKHLKYA